MVRQQMANRWPRPHAKQYGHRGSATSCGDRLAPVRFATGGTMRCVRSLPTTLSGKVGQTWIAKTMWFLPALAERALFHGMPGTSQPCLRRQHATAGVSLHICALSSDVTPSGSAAKHAKNRVAGSGLGNLDMFSVSAS